jgi:hypothetical protein
MRISTFVWEIYSRKDFKMWYRTEDGQLLNLDQIVAIKFPNQEAGITNYICLLSTGHGIVVSEADANMIFKFIKVVNAVPSGKAVN